MQDEERLERIRKKAAEYEEKRYQHEEFQGHVDSVKLERVRQKAEILEKQKKTQQEFANECAAIREVYELNEDEMAKIYRQVEEEFQQQPPSPPAPVKTLFSPKVKSWWPFFFSAKGRISRLQYIIGTGLIFFLNMIISSTAFMIFPVGLLSVATIFAQFILSIKRSHDRNRSGLFVLLGLIPLVNIWVLIELLFLPGTNGPNDYGDDPLNLIE